MNHRLTWVKRELCNNKGLVCNTLAFDTCNFCSLWRISGNDKNKWLPGLDPTHRETMLSIGAFLQNLEYAAGNSGYDCDFVVLAASNEEENVVEVRLVKSAIREYDVEKIKQRRTVRSNYKDEPLKNGDVKFLITSKDDSVASLLEAGKRMERLFLKVRERNIAQHPMTQILEETPTNQILPGSLGLGEPVQFILRTGYLKNYPEPVSLRRPVETFLRV